MRFKSGKYKLISYSDSIYDSKVNSYARSTNHTYGMDVTIWTRFLSRLSLSFLLVDSQYQEVENFIPPVDMQAKPSRRSRMVSLVVRCLLVSAGIVLVGCQHLYPDCKGCDITGYSVLYAEEAPDDPMRIEVYHQEPFSMGPSSIKVFMYPLDGDKQLLLTEKIYNDGANLMIKNAGIVWQINQRAQLYIRGQEQATKIYTIDYSDPEQIDIELLEEG